MSSPLPSMRVGRPSRLRGPSAKRSATSTMRRYALALFDAVRLFLHVSAAAVSGWLALVIYYAPESFIPLENLRLFFDASTFHYAQLSCLGGLIFSGVTFLKYGRATITARDEWIQRMMSTWCISLLIVVSVLFLLKSGSDYSRGWMIVWASITPVFIAISYKIERLVVSMLRHIGFDRRRVAIVGATSQATRLRESFLRSDAPDGFDLIGVFDDPPLGDDVGRAVTAVHGSVFELKQLCRKEPVDAIVIALPSSESRLITDTVERLLEVPADIYLGPDLAHFDLAMQRRTHLGTIPVTSLTRLPMRDWAGIAKTIEDKAIVLIAGFLLAPLLALTALLIKLDSPGPVLFRQRRYGFNNAGFDVYKFRTMTAEQCDASGVRQTGRDDERITRIGRFLRRTSIDELPQLLNVWRGEMSIVGPRAHPIDMRVADQPYDEMVRHYAARHRVKPGITGLAQVNGNRGEVTTREKAEGRVHHDLFYIDNWSIWLDLVIIVRTVIKLPFDRSAY